MKPFLTAFCKLLSCTKPYPLLSAFRLLEPKDKGAALHEAIAQLTTGNPNNHTFPVEPASFQQVPGAPFAYWVSKETSGFPIIR